MIKKTVHHQNCPIITDGKTDRYQQSIVTVVYIFGLCIYREIKPQFIA